MSESFEQKQPAWQDISLEEIQDLLDEEQVQKALLFTRLRLEGIQGLPEEISQAEAAATDVTAQQWRYEREELRRELQALEAILARYQQ